MAAVLGLARRLERLEGDSVRFADGTPPEARWLVTSRQPLHLAGEHEYAVDPVGKPRVVGGFADADVKSVTWVNDDDIAVWRDDERREPIATFRTLRQQMAKPDGRPNVALSDYTAPVGSGESSKRAKTRLTFPSTTGSG